jgi:acyl-CoA thioester hydrolase
MLSLKPFRRRAAPPTREIVLQHADGALGNGPVPQMDGVDAALPADQPSIRTFETLRFADTDLNGHITHPVVAALFQNGRALLLVNQAARLASPGMRWVTRSVSIDYRREIFWPGTAEICTRIVRLGNSSIHIDQDLLQEKTSKATGQAVMVLMDVATRRSVTIPAALRQALSGIAEGTSSA